MIDIFSRDLYHFLQTVINKPGENMMLGVLPPLLF